MPVSFRGRLVQYAGRLHRKHPGKKAVRIHDYVDGKVPVLQRVFQRRLKTCKAMGYTIVRTWENGGSEPEAGSIFSQR